jgi:predicted ATPase
MAMHYQASSLTNNHDHPLKFSKRLCGRELELARLAAIYHNFCRREEGGNDRTEKSRMVCISGYSGTGKSSLFQEFARNIVDKRCHVIMGKFDELQGAKAFSAVAEAFDGLCERLVKEQPANLSRIQASVQEAVGTESKVLKDVIPGLSILLGDSMNHQEVSTCSQENEWNRLIYVFKRFLHALYKSSLPVVLFLDDLQWSDDSSLDLIQALVTDKDLRHRLFFIGAFRSNEVNVAQHPLTSTLQTIGEWTSLEHIQMENLSLEAINKFIADTLSLDTQDTMPLSKAVYSKTHGNIFFTTQVMESLRQQGILAKSTLNFQWTWRLEQIDAVTSISDNVVDVIMGKLSELSSSLQTVLAVAAYMRTLIHPPTLRVFLQLEGRGMTDFALEELLNKAAEEGLLQTSGDGTFRFAHDLIKQACYGLVAEGLERNALRKRLGKYLVKRGKSTFGETWMFFVAADHLAALPAPELAEVLDQVRLNLRVGKMAVKVSALVPASRYLHKALALLETVESHWQSHYKLSCSLYRSASDVELILGHFEQGSSLCHVLLRNAKEDKDKMRAYRSLGKALGRRARHAESLQYHLKAVHLIKEFPKRFLLGHISREYSIVKKILKKKSDFDIMTLPINSDETKIAAMEHLLNISVRALYCSNFSVMFLADLRLLTLTVELEM